MSVGIYGNSDGPKQAHQCPLNPEHGWWPDECIVCVEEDYYQKEKRFTEMFRASADANEMREAMKADQAAYRAKRDAWREDDARRELKVKVDAQRKAMKASRLSDRAKDAKRRTDIQRALIKAEVKAEQDCIQQCPKNPAHGSWLDGCRTCVHEYYAAEQDAARARKLTPRQKRYLAAWFMVPAIYFFLAVVVNSPFGIGWFLLGLVWIALLLREASTYRKRNEAAALRAAKAPVEKARLAASIAELEKDNDIQSLEYRIAEMDEKLGVTPEKRSKPYFWPQPSLLGVPDEDLYTVFDGAGGEITSYNPLLRKARDWADEQCEQHESGAHSAVPPPWEEP